MESITQPFQSQHFMIGIEAQFKQAVDALMSYVRLQGLGGEPDSAAILATGDGIARLTFVVGQVFFG